MPFKGSLSANSIVLCLAALLVANSTSCLVRRRNITRKGGQPTQTLLNADKASLIKEIATIAESLPEDGSKKND